MVSDPADRTDAEGPAAGRPDAARAGTAGAPDRAAHRDAVEAAIARELDGRDDSRPFSAEELRTAARGVVAAVGPEAAVEMREWAWELLELLGADEDERVDRYASMVAWRLVERFDARRGSRGSGGRADDEGASDHGEVDGPGDDGSAPSPEAPSS